jgi:hypothetical protein
MKQVLLLLLFASGLGCFGQIVNQTDYDIKNPGRDLSKCKKTHVTLNQMPNDVRFSTIIKNDSIYLVLNSRSWFEKILQGKNDGAAIDIVQQTQFSCDKNSSAQVNFSHIGFLTKPIYKNELLKRTVEWRDGVIATNMGPVPKELVNTSIEANYLLLQDKFLCWTGSLVSVDFNGWKLLENGLYYDTLTKEGIKNKYKDVAKTLNFIIPFEKDKSQYNHSDILPLIDSLKMTDYSIKEISIRAFTSVEGDYKRNLKLQKDRAESIVNALQSYQTEKIQSTISTQENWVDFLDDIQYSPYKNLAILSKDEVKEKLRAKDLQEKLEPILQKHRKGIIQIKLEKRLTFEENDEKQLKKYFLQMIEEKNIEQALYLQQIIFYKIRKRQLPETYLTTLEVPESIENGRLLINEGAFLYDNETTDVFEAIRTFQNLKTLLPNNPKVDYNLCALKLQAWLHTSLIQPREELKREIEALRAKKIPDPLVRRLLINYHIILSEVQLRNQNYSAKDKSVLFIFQTYLPLKLDDADLVNLAKYFSHYSKFDWATKILQPRVRAIDVSEDLVFYYLSLTIYKSTNTKSINYRSIMLNAVNENRPRFCELFNSTMDGGISFQLLNDSYLKRTFCENCQEINE